MFVTTFVLGALLSPPAQWSPDKPGFATPVSTAPKRSEVQYFV